MCIAVFYFLMQKYKTNHVRSVTPQRFYSGFISKENLLVKKFSV